MKGLRVLVEGFEVLHKTVAGFKVRYWFLGYRVQVSRLEGAGCRVQGYWLKGSRYSDWW